MERPLPLEVLNFGAFTGSGRRAGAPSLSSAVVRSSSLDSVPDHSHSFLIGVGFYSCGLPGRHGSERDGTEGQAKAETFHGGELSARVFTRSQTSLPHAELGSMSNASSALSDVSSGHLGRRQAEPRQRYGAVTAAGANEMGPLPPLPPLPFTSPISPPSALPPLPPLPPLNTSGSPMKTQARRHSAPIVSSPSKRSYVSPFPPPTSPLPPIPSEDGLMYPGWPASLSAISQGLDPMRGVMRNGAARKTPPVWPPSRRPAHEDEEEEEEWRHPYAIASSPTRDYQWDRPQSDLDDAKARRRSTDRGSEAYNGMSPLDLPPIDSLPPFGMIGTSKRSLGSGQRRVRPSLDNSDPC